MPVRAIKHVLGCVPRGPHQVHTLTLTPTLALPGACSCSKLLEVARTVWRIRGPCKCAF
jgi:hypothetical protein